MDKMEISMSHFLQYFIMHLYVTLQYRSSNMLLHVYTTPNIYRIPMDVATLTVFCPLVPKQQLESPHAKTQLLGAHIIMGYVQRSYAHHGNEHGSTFSNFQI